ncbi:MAG: HAMP domain-containing histidine kinase [Chloroflexota bacterium]|nr:HAMP domain-containing histidine kinase [Chloroflexota bacterium]
METQPQPAHPSRARSARAATAATVGLAAVGLCFAAFSIFAAFTAREQVNRAEHVEAVQEAYVRATGAMQTAETIELEYHLEPTAAHLVALDLANEAVIVAVNEAAALGDETDARLAVDILALHERHLGATKQFTAAIAAGDPVEARRIDVQLSDPIIEKMHAILTAASDDAEAANIAAFAALRGTAELTLILAPAVFVVGFVFLFLLWRILARSQLAARKTYREIEQLSKLRSEFVSIVSHEFRTPLTGIQGFSEMMRDENMTLPEMREYAGDINKDARRLARLITDMLDLDRMESGKMTLNSEPVDLNRIVTDAAAPFRLSAADHPIELHLDARLHDLLGDSDRLTQIVTNLVSNAIKYSPAGGAVQLRTEREERTVTLTVTDHGMGIPEAQLEKIFDRYSRVETAETRVIQGTGLGLPIVRQILQLCGGRVWATSEPGHGSVFHVQLPLLEAATPAPLAA